MRLQEIDEIWPKVGDILEVELGDELVETVIVSIHNNTYIVETDSDSAVALLESELELDEKAPPGMEDWIRDRKADFKKRYGDRWEEVLYATAWKRKKNESLEEKQRLDPKCWNGYKKQGTKMKGGVRVNNCVKEEEITEAEYQGRQVKLGKPQQGDVKKFKVYVRNPKTGKIIKVNFGDPNMRIKKSNPKRRKSFRARHNCSNPGPRTKARYWSCRKW